MLVEKGDKMKKSIKTTHTEIRNEPGTRNPGTKGPRIKSTPPPPPKK